MTKSNFEQNAPVAPDFLGISSLVSKKQVKTFLHYRYLLGEKRPLSIVRNQNVTISCSKQDCQIWSSVR